MRALASLLCGFVFGWGLFISGMMRPDKVLGLSRYPRHPERQLGSEPRRRHGGRARRHRHRLRACAAARAGFRSQEPVADANRHRSPACCRLDSVRHRLGLGRPVSRDRRSPIWRPCRRPSSCSSLPWRSARSRTISGMRGALQRAHHRSRRRMPTAESRLLHGAFETKSVRIARQSYCERWVARLSARRTRASASLGPRASDRAPRSRILRRHYLLRKALEIASTRVGWPSSSLTHLTVPLSFLTPVAVFN